MPWPVRSREEDQGQGQLGQGAYRRPLLSSRQTNQQQHQQREVNRRWPRHRYTVKIAGSIMNVSWPGVLGKNRPSKKNRQGIHVNIHLDQRRLSRRVNELSSLKIQRMIKRRQRLPMVTSPRIRIRIWTRNMTERCHRHLLIAMIVGHKPSFWVKYDADNIR